MCVLQDMKLRKLSPRGGEQEEENERRRRGKEGEEGGGGGGVGGEGGDHNCNAVFHSNAAELYFFPRELFLSRSRRRERGRSGAEQG